MQARCMCIIKPKTISTFFCGRNFQHFFSFRHWSRVRNNTLRVIAMVQVQNCTKCILKCLEGDFIADHIPKLNDSSLSSTHPALTRPRISGQRCSFQTCARSPRFRSDASATFPLGRKSRFINQLREMDGRLSWQKLRLDHTWCRVAPPSSFLFYRVFFASSSNFLSKGIIEVYGWK